MGRSTSFTVIVGSILAALILMVIMKSDPPAGTTPSPQPNAKRVYFNWTVETQNVTRACNTTSIAIVNNMLPGPTVHANEGDTLVIQVTSKVADPVTIHWHGINQVMTNWADGVAGITQCSLAMGDSYTYEFTLIDQVGTYFWHAHVSWLRATVYGAIIIHPMDPPPYATPAAEIPILFGEWFDENPVTIEKEGLASYGPVFTSYAAYTLNGWPGPLYNCSNGNYVRLDVVSGKTYLLQLINAALNNNHFFQIANHTMTVVATDGEYVKPFNTTRVVLSPGQSLDVLVTANQPTGKYYFGISGWEAFILGFVSDVTTPAVGVLNYNGSSSSATPIMPDFPEVSAASLNLGYPFFAKLKALKASNLPKKVDRELIFATALASVVCNPSEDCSNVTITKKGTKFVATMNNVTFDLPTNASILESYYYNKPGVYMTDFPPVPPAIVNFTSSTPIASYNETAFRGARTLVLKYNETVQVVLQDLNVFFLDYHPFHLHGHNFYVVGSGFGNYDPNTDPQNFNLEDPNSRSTVGLPAGGWVAIRFTANNPGVWTFHCHFERHLSWGMIMAFITENGNGPNATLPPPKHTPPVCHQTTATLQSASGSSPVRSFIKASLRG